MRRKLFNQPAPVSLVLDADQLAVVDALALDTLNTRAEMLRELIGQGVAFYGASVLSPAEARAVLRQCARRALQRPAHAVRKGSRSHG